LGGAIGLSRDSEGELKYRMAPRSKIDCIFIVRDYPDLDAGIRAKSTWVVQSGNTVQTATVICRATKMPMLTADCVGMFSKSRRIAYFRRERVDYMRR